MDLCRQLQLDPVVFPYVLIACVSAPILLHAFVYFLPAVWRGRFYSGAAAVDGFATISRMLVALQACSVLAFVWGNRPTGLCFDPTLITLPNWTLGLGMFGLGAHLVHAVLRSVGTRGLYYGSRLLANRGPSAKQHQQLAAEPSGWPHSVVPHPEYVGAILLVWSPVVVLLQQLPSSVVFVASFLSTLFAFSWFYEDLL